MAGIGPKPRDLRDEVEPVYLLTRRRSSVPPPPARSPSVPPEDSVVRVARRRPSDGSIESLGELERVPPMAEQRAHLAAPGARENRTSLPNEAAWYDDDALDGESDTVGVRRASRRSRAIRVLGTLAVLGTLGGGAFLVQQPKVRREALSFVTMGHEESASRLGRRIASIVDGWRGR